MELLTLSYQNFINICHNKNLRIQTKNLDDYYTLFAFDGNSLEYAADIVVGSPEWDDFQANYASLANKSINQLDIYGNPVSAPTLDTTLGKKPKAITSYQEVTQTATNFFDTEVTSAWELKGGLFWVYEEDVDKIGKLDYVEFSVIDKNDILGLFSLYNLTVGTSFLEVGKFVYNGYVKAGSKSQNYFSNYCDLFKGTTQLIPGLFTRITYLSVGALPISFFTRLVYYA
jgi:hypothetical protein